MIEVALYDSDGRRILLVKGQRDESIRYHPVTLEAGTYFVAMVERPDEHLASNVALPGSRSFASEEEPGWHGWMDVDGMGNVTPHVGDVERDDTE